jgi:hypothetical protein
MSDWTEPRAGFWIRETGPFRIYVEFWQTKNDWHWRISQSFIEDEILGGGAFDSKEKAQQAAEEALRQYCAQQIEELRGVLVSDLGGTDS